MKKGIAWCPHCGEPHSLRETVCPKTARPLSRSLHRPSANVASDTPTPGLVISNRYQLVRCIGRGGMGEVFEARDLSLGRAVAVKVVLRATPEARARLEREGRIIAALDHESICKVFDFGALPSGIPYLVLERVRGEPLSKRLKRTGTLSIGLVLHIFGQVLVGLENAHAKGIVHRDMKPANIYLATVPNSLPRAKILDFGLAKDLFGSTSTSFTRPGRAVGTPGYMAPEQLCGRPIDGRTDLFAVGIMMFEALTGKHPFGSSHTSVAELASNIVRGIRKDIRELRNDLPAPLVALIDAALQIDPDKRPQSAREMSEALSAITADADDIAATLTEESPYSDLPRIASSTDTSVTSVTGVSSVSSVGDTKVEPTIIE